MRRFIGLLLAASMAVTATACGGDPDKKDAAAATPAATSSASAAPHGVASSPAGDDEVVYHDAVAGNDVTVKMFRKVIAQMPKAMTCDELLTGGKALGNTYPHGEGFYLRVCQESGRK